MDWRYSNHPDHRKRINVVINADTLQDDVRFKGMFAPAIMDDENGTEIYTKCLFQNDKNFTLYWVKQGYQEGLNGRGLKVNGAVVILDLFHETKKTFFERILNFFNHAAI